MLKQKKGRGFMNLVDKENPVENIQVLEEPLVVQSFEQEPVSQPSNPVLQEFNVPMVEENHVEPTYVVEQQPIMPTPTVQPVNPVLQEFAVPSNSAVEEIPIVQEQPVNPVLQQFGMMNTPVVEEQSVLNQEVIRRVIYNICNMNSAV